MRPDVYYGDVAENYDASRSVKAKWKEELAAVQEFLTDGPVLDVPFGTGRFVPIYRAKRFDFEGVDISVDMLTVAKRKFPGINVSQGSVFDLQFAHGEFATVVCVRLLEWLPLERAKELLDRLRRIATTLIITINHGTEGQPEAYTYDYGKFLYAIDGLTIEGRRVTAQIPGIVSEAFKLRPAKWDDVVAQFSHDHGEDAWDNLKRLADKHAAFFGLPPNPMGVFVTVRAEYWSGEKLGACVDALAGHRFITDVRPRRTDMPITAIERDGVTLIIDGRKRANLWRNEPGPHPVLVIR
jgi:2-polyprenyl-3-methyl-5-hydroxy-6-metoxy-1,4-benzoquinol methylase